MGIIPDETWQQLRSQPDWQERVRAWLDTWPEGRWLRLTLSVATGAMDYWDNLGLLDQPGWWEETRARLVRAGAWDPIRDQFTRSLAHEHIYRAVIENLDVAESSARLIAEVERLIDLQAASNGEGLPPAPEPMITLSVNDLEDLLLLAAAEQRAEDASEDDWVPWEEIEAGLKA